MRKFNSKYTLFHFRDGTILDVSKIDLIKERDAENATIYISGTQLSIDRDDEFEKLIKTWDMYIRNKETNAELMYKQAKINGVDLDIISKKIDIILAIYSRTHKDEVPEYPLGDDVKK